MAIALLASPVWVLATGGASARVQVAISSILRMEVQPAPLSFHFEEANYDLESGTATQVSSNLSEVRVLANHRWHVQVRADAATFAHTAVEAGGPSAAKPVSHLAARRTTDSGFVSLSTENQTIASGSPGGFGANTFEVEYQLESNLAEDVLGDYTITLTYSVIPE